MCRQLKLDNAKEFLRKTKIALPERDKKIVSLIRKILSRLALVDREFAEITYGIYKGPVLKPRQAARRFKIDVRQYHIRIWAICGHVRGIYEEEIRNRAT